MGMPPLIITGMHRSGTSATARLLQHAGLDLGTRLMAPRLDNPLGYYEDLDFSDLNRALVAAGVGDDPRCRPDWAFADRIEPGRLVALRPRAAALIAEQSIRQHPWGFKDPRTAILLDFYDDLVPGARYLFVYRAPWDVLASLLQTQERPLQGRAGLAVETWMTYNARLLDFRERHPGRTALIHVDAVAHRPSAVVGLAQALVEDLASAKLDADAGGGAFVDRLLHRTGAGSPLAELLAADHPGAIALYARLEATAEIASLEPGPGRSHPAVAIEETRGALPLNAVLVGAGAGGAHDATLVARPAAGAAPGDAADAGVDQLPGDLVAVVFDAQLRPAALSAAVAALQHDTGLGAVLLAAATPSNARGEDDLLARADPGAAIVVRRDAWLTTRGFAAAHAPAGFEAWSFAVGCLAQGIRTARLTGALEGSRSELDAEAARRWALQRFPALAARRAEEAEADRDRLELQLEALHTTRAWRVVTRWWRLRERLRRSRRGR